MSPFMADLFNRDFKAFLNGRQFLHFIKRFDLIKINTPGTYICKSDTVFDSIYYVAKINPDYKLCITSADSSFKIKDITEGSWIGVIEYAAFDEQLGKKTKIKQATGKSRRFDVLWGVNCFVEKISDKDKNHPEYNLRKEQKNINIIKDNLTKAGLDPNQAEVLLNNQTNNFDNNYQVPNLEAMPNPNIEVLTKKDNQFSKIENSSIPLTNENVDGVLLYKMSLKVSIKI